MYSIFEELMRARGVNALTVSKATGISTGTLSDWKNGRIKELKADKLKLIADYFDVFSFRGVEKNGYDAKVEKR